MQDRRLRCSRRKFLARAAAVTLAGGMTSAADARPAAPDGPARPPQVPPAVDGRRPIAVVCTVYRPLSHAYHIAGRFLHGYLKDGRHHLPGFYVRSVCVDQTPENDLSRDLAREFGFHHTRSVAEALTLGGDRLAVDGVLLIGEHGNYPRNDRGQILYPRYEMFEQIVEVFRKTGKAVPVFNDKHLSHALDRARTMLGWSEELKFPLMAGSSLPVTWRRPELELPLGAELSEGLVAGYGPVEVYGFHGLEALQVMMERRGRGETGVRAVTTLTGRDVWKAGDAGRWSWDLLDAALARGETVNLGDVRRNTGTLAVGAMPITPPTAFLVEYRDGSKGTVLLLNGHTQEFCFAGRVRGGEPRAASCLFHLPAPPGARYFDALAANIEKLFETGASPTPVRRTLLTTGVLEAAMESHARRGARVETAGLEVAYTAPADSGFARGSVVAM